MFMVNELRVRLNIIYTIPTKHSSRILLCKFLTEVLTNFSYLSRYRTNYMI